ncbi:arrestin domain-containing protein 3 [Trichonephila clavata]|uniref:Arrestin domain-containing protein 3 n=1 Tax=Trichonephila clavata TaxID=2740835 RepID=A0A8X6K951_TRICU|nr:arrestin domain-containing protein 3 [Trichonephila clavata]
MMQQPFHCEIEDTLGIPCLNSGPVSCRVRLDRGGYVPGESICLFATIDNGSRVTIKKTKAILTEQQKVSPNGGSWKDELSCLRNPITYSSVICFMCHLSPGRKSEKNNGNDV